MNSSEKLVRNCQITVEWLKTENMKIKDSESSWCLNTENS